MLSSLGLVSPEVHWMCVTVAMKITWYHASDTPVLFRNFELVSSNPPHQEDINFVASIC